MRSGGQEKRRLGYGAILCVERTLERKLGEEKRVPRVVTTRMIKTLKKERELVCWEGENGIFG